MKVKSCCCCIPVKVGAYIIGCIHVLGLILGVILVSPLQVSLEIFCGCTFLYMAYRDNDKNRLLYFAAYVVYSSILASIRMIFVFWDRDEKEMVLQYCKQAEETVLAEGGAQLAHTWQDLGFEDMADCKSKVGFAVARDEFVSLLVTLLL